MSMVNADSVQLFAMLKKMQDSISSIETTKKSVKMKYEQLGAGWQDKKYNELGVVVRDCNKALNDILVIMLQAEKYVALLAKSLSEYESVQLGSTNGISASTPQTSSFAVTPSSADTTTFESNTFGSNLAFVQDRLSAERYFSRGNHYEEYTAVPRLRGNEGHPTFQPSLRFRQGNHETVPDEELPDSCWNGLLHSNRDKDATGILPTSDAHIRMLLPVPH